MQMSATIRVAAPAEQTLEILANEAFIAFATGRSDMHLLSIDIDRLDSGALTSVVRRNAKSDLIPSNFRSLVGAEIELRQTEAWAEAIPVGGVTRHGTFDLEIVGAPVRISGRTSITENNGESVLVYSGDIVASIPLFGATIEKAVGGAVQEVLNAQERLLDEWLTAQQ